MNENIESLSDNDPEQTVVILSLFRMNSETRQLIKESKLFVANKPDESEKAWAAYTAYRELALQFNKITADYLESIGVRFDAKQD